MEKSFNPAEAVRFDLSKGSIRNVDAAGEAGERVVLVPVSALERAMKMGGEAVGAAIGSTLGTSCGRRVAARLGGVTQVNQASLETVVYELNGEMARSGLGSLALERWGRAMVLVVEGAAVASEPLVSAALEGALRAATGRDISCITLSHGVADPARVLVASRSGADRVRGWLASGVSWGDALVRLQGGARPNG
jgi:hypothetical protein